MEQTFPREIKMDFILFMITSMALFGGGVERDWLSVHISNLTKVTGAGVVTF